MRLEPGAGQLEDPAKPKLRGWLHTGALPLAAGAGSWLASQGRGAGEQAALGLYAAALVALFGVSASYHRLHWSPAGRRRMRRVDHTTIFLAIAGTYTAVAVMALSGWARWCILGVVWAGAVAGVAVRQWAMDAATAVVALTYLVVGWCALAVLPQLERGLGGGSFALLLAGGACYTLGALVYARRWPDPSPGVFGYHEVFHACTVAGAALQLAAVAGVTLRGG